jgi:WD40 repeat protein
VLDELLSDSVSPVSFSPDGKYLAYCSHDETVKLWSFESQKEVTMLKEHSYSVNSIVFSPDGKYLASSSD